MSSADAIISWQHKWAGKSGLSMGLDGYLLDMNSNFFRPMNKSTEDAYNSSGGGSEMRSIRKKPMKICAPHSSAALTINFFDTWVTEPNKSPLQKTFQISKNISTIFLKEKFPTILPGGKPHLDVTLHLENNFVIGIENKFSEWLAGSKSNGSRNYFKPVYFSDTKNRNYSITKTLWADQGLKKSQELAEKIYKKSIVFHHLDAAQFLKHALGLATQLGKCFSLYYVYFDCRSRVSVGHKQEIDRFLNAVGNELDFKVFTYQEIFSALQQQQGVDPKYLAYLNKRYFSSAP